MADYFAYDMANGKTYIGKPVPNTISNMLRLEQAVVLDTMDTATSNGKVIDVKTGYRLKYMMIAKALKYNMLTPELINSLSTAYLEKNPQNNTLQGVIAIWYLGKDILEDRQQQTPPQKKK